MNPTSLLGLAGLIVVGIIVADFVTNPGGPTVINSFTNLVGTVISGLTGNAPKPVPGQPVAGKKK